MVCAVMTLIALPLVVSLLSAVVSAGAAAAEREEIGSFRSWTAYRGVKDGVHYCYMGSEPKKAEGSYSRRGPTFVLVTHWPGEKIQGEVSVEAGYAYNAGSEVTVRIGKQSFRLFTQNRKNGDGIAWSYNAEGDRALVAAMKSGNEMVVEGTSRRGTLTRDTYSLSGFSTAYEEITKACSRT
jgi:hypothetical protein